MNLATWLIPDLRSSSDGDPLSRSDAPFHSADLVMLVQFFTEFFLIVNPVRDLFFPFGVGRRI